MLSNVSMSILNFKGSLYCLNPHRSTSTLQEVNQAKTIDGYDTLDGLENLRNAIEERTPKENEYEINITTENLLNGWGGFNKPSLGTSKLVTEVKKDDRGEIYQEAFNVLG